VKLNFTGDFFALLAVGVGRGVGGLGLERGVEEGRKAGFSIHELRFVIHGFI
jgi:hypothetical protein